jgi:hypothetical protein
MLALLIALGVLLGVFLLFEGGKPTDDEVAGSLEAHLIDRIATENERHGQLAEDGNAFAAQLGEMQVDRGLTHCRNKSETPGDDAREVEWDCLTRVTSTGGQETVWAWAVEPTGGKCWEASPYLVKYPDGTSTQTVPEMHEEGCAGDVAKSDLPD